MERTAQDTMRAVALDRFGGGPELLRLQALPVLEVGPEEVLNADLVSAVPDQLTSEQAGVMAGVAVAALRGLDDTLGLEARESLAIVGAGGGIGHVAVQLAKRMGARVFAVASGDDGVGLADRLGADAAVDGHTDDIPAALRAFAPEGMDAVLLTAGGAVAEQALSAVREGGRVAGSTVSSGRVRSRFTSLAHSRSITPPMPIAHSTVTTSESSPYG